MHDASPMNSFTRTILASTLAVCVSQAALGASVIPHASIPGLVDFGVPFAQNGKVVMSEKYDVVRPNRELSDRFKLRPDGYADYVEYHVKHLSPDEPTFEVTRVHVPGIRRAEVDQAVAFYVDQMAKSSGEAFVKKGSNYLSETFDIVVHGTSIAVMVAPAVAQAAEIEALMKRKDYRMRIGAVTLGIDSKDSLEKLFKEKRGCKVKRIWQDKRWETKGVCFGFPEEKYGWVHFDGNHAAQAQVTMKYDKDLHDALIYELRSKYKPAPSLPSQDFFWAVPWDEYSGTAWKNSKPELVIEVVELLKNRIAVNATLGNHVNVEDARAARRALIEKIRAESHDNPAKPELAKGLF